VRILALALGIPFPPLGGGLTRTYHLLQALARHHEVVLAGFTYGESHDAPPFPIDVHTTPWRWSAAYQRMVGADPAASRDAFAELTFGTADPWFVSVMDRTGMETMLAGIVAKTPDVILLEGSALAGLLPALPGDVPRVLDLFDVHTVMARRAVERADDAGRPAALREAERTEAFERRAVEGCAACLTVSDGDAAAARTVLGAASVYVVPNGVDTAYFAPSLEAPVSGTVLFTGRMSYEPNVDAACHFAADVLPLVRREMPAARFHIVGAGGSPRVAALASPVVEVHGRVDDVRPHHRAAEVVVVPVRFGGGTRLKVLEAAACGKAIVSTSLGVEGLAFRDGVEVVVADDAAAMAQAIVAVLRDPARRIAMGAAARRVAEHYDWTGIGASCRAILEEVGGVTCRVPGFTKL
jgi:polysaccharide biosynthesis protein PslH